MDQPQHSSGMIFPSEQGQETCIFAPQVARIYLAQEVSPYFDGDESCKSACLDILAGDDADQLMHVAVGITPPEARSLIENARIIHRPLILWINAPIPGCINVRTGKQVLIGFLDRLGTRGPTTQ